MGSLPVSDPALPDATDLAALVGSRLCHDLASPLGAIGNGVELLQMVSPPSPELTLIAEAVAAAQARLKLFRLAFGAATDNQQVTRTDLIAALSALSANPRLAIHSTITQDLPRTLARRLVLAVLCAETALARGGELIVSETRVEARSPRLRRDETLWQALRDGQPLRDTTPALAHFALLAASGPVTIDDQGEALCLTL